MSLKDTHIIYEDLIRHQQDPLLNENLSSLTRDWLSQQNDGRRILYSELIYKNFLSVLETAYPLIFKWIDEVKKYEIVASFLKHGISPSPLYRDIPLSFKHYYINNPMPLSWPKQLLEDILLYDFTTYDILFRQNQIFSSDLEADISLCQPILNIHACSLYLNYPLHQLESSPQEIKARPTHLFIVRNPQTHEIHQWEDRSELTQFFSILQNNPKKTIDELMHITNYQPEAFLKLLHIAFNKKLILGFKMKET